MDSLFLAAGVPQAVAVLVALTAPAPVGAVTTAAEVVVGALAGLAGAAAAFSAAFALYRMQRERVAAGVVSTFSRSLLVVFALMMLTGLASLATLVPSPQMYMGFLGGGAVTTLVALASMRRR